MTAICMGNFGTYQYLWSRHVRDMQGRGSPGEETVWVTKRYIPTDLRVSAPVARHKLIAPDVKDLPKPADHWLPHRQGQSHPMSQIRGRELAVYSSQPSTRCEEWSTLRRILPSSGSAIRTIPANWGTGHVAPPVMTPAFQRRFPHINSPMTRYIIYSFKLLSGFPIYLEYDLTKECTLHTAVFIIL